MTSAKPWEDMSIHAGPQDSPGFVLWRDFMRWQRQLNAQLKPLRLTQPQFAVLAVCGWLTRDGRDVTQQELVDFLDMDRMHISQIATRLEQDGLIRRRATARDRRAKLVSLTAAGQAILERAMPVVEAFDRAFFACPAR
ncbi:MAG: transcriptional regulator [Proteobacteria bacterium]|nr:transcriptional regulator [Pseudomonadota bacterium]